MRRRTADQVPLIDSDDPERDAEMIRRWKAAIDRAADAIGPSARPKLRAGKSVLVDQCRMFHGREAYADLEASLVRLQEDVRTGVIYQDARPGHESAHTRIGWHSLHQAYPNSDFHPSIALTFHLDATLPPRRNPSTSTQRRRPTGSFGSFRAVTGGGPEVYR